MRRLHQKQILDALAALEEARVEIKRAFDKGAYETVMSGLMDCDASAGRIQGFIAEVAGEGTQTHDFLEEFRKCLMQMHATVEGGGRSDNNFLKTLRRHILKIKNSVKGELKPNKIEVAFMPYKAAMFDSLESIWRAAEDDPSCDAYVVPVPYHDYTPDHKLGQLHDESGLYPPDIPIADWRTYDVEFRRPDVIFIMNPYDEGNYVTCVHPDFHARRLANFTDMLAYSPYFVARGNNISKEFCLSAGTIYADKVFLQSEKIRQTYIRVFREWAKNSGITRQHPLWGKAGKPESKFVALGSPKFDAVVNAKPEDFELPDAWRKLIEKPDGTRKKVVLYNARFTDFTAGVENMLAKLENVLALFKSRDDVVLWFRPHPLNLSCLEAMRPQFAQEYATMINDYRDAGWGIYDESAGLHRGIAWSDAYAGDCSSLVVLYETVGKPVMVVGNSVLAGESKNNSICFAGHFDDGKYLWFTASYANALFKMDKRSWKADYMGTVPEFTNLNASSYGGIAECNGMLYFAPFYANCIGTYDLKSCLFDKLAIKNLNSPRNHKCYTLCAYGSCVYIFGLTYPSIIKLNTDTKQMTYISDWITPLKKLRTNDDNYFFSAVSVRGNEAVLSTLSANAAVIFNMDTCRSKIIEIPSKNNGYQDICFDGEYYWLAARYSGGTIVKWHPERGVVEIPVPNGWADSDYWYVCYANGYAWYFPIHGNTAFKVNTTTDGVEIAEPFMPERRFGNENKTSQTASHNYYMAYAAGGIVYAHTSRSNTLIAYNTVTGERREEAIAISAEDRHKLVNDTVLRYCNKDLLQSMGDCVFMECVFMESETFTLNDFLDRLSDGSKETWDKVKETQIELCRENITNADGSAGKAIYEEVKRIILGYSQST
jgi:hypothetical protein